MALISSLVRTGAWDQAVRRLINFSSLTGRAYSIKYGRVTAHFFSLTSSRCFCCTSVRSLSTIQGQSSKKKNNFHYKLSVLAPDMNAMWQVIRFRLTTEIRCHFYFHSLILRPFKVKCWNSILFVCHHETPAARSSHLAYWTDVRLSDGSMFSVEQIVDSIVLYYIILFLICRDHITALSGFNCATLNSFLILRQYLKCSRVNL